MFLLQNAQLGGIVSTLIAGIKDSLGFVFDWIFSWLIDTVWTAFATHIYQNMISPMLMFIDGISIVFRKFAGLGSYTSHGVVHTNSDFLYTLITNSTIMNIFWSMLILGVILLFITTFVAVIKSETTELGDSKGGNNKVKILKQTFRTILNFAIVPICAVVGIMMGNVLLRSLDQATGGKNGYTGGMGNRIFVSSAYNANRVRIAIGYYENDTKGKESLEDWLIANSLAQEFYKKDLVDLIQENRAYELADSIDELFINTHSNDRLDRINGYTGGIDVILDVIQIGKYYNIGRYNLILGFVESIGVIALLINITLGLIKRLFTVVALFVCAPPIVAVSPLNPGILKEWNKNFISQVLAGYGAVVGMNLFLIILGAISDIQFLSAAEVGGTVAGLLNSVIMILVMIAGLFFVKDLISMLSKMIGGDDVNAVGSAVAGKMAAVVGAGVATAVGGGALLGNVLKKSKGLGSATRDLSQAEKMLNKAKKKQMKDSEYNKKTLAMAKESGDKDAIKKARAKMSTDNLQNGKAVKAAEKLHSEAQSNYETKEKFFKDKYDGKIAASKQRFIGAGKNFMDSVSENKLFKSYSDVTKNVYSKDDLHELGGDIKGVFKSGKNAVKAGGVKLAETAKDVVEGTKQQAGIVKAYYTPEVEKMKRNFTKLRGRIEFNRALNSAKYYKTKEIKPNQTVEVVDMKSFELKGFDENDFKSKSGTNYHDIPKEKRDKTVKRKINQRKKK